MISSVLTPNLVSVPREGYGLRDFQTVPLIDTAAATLRGFVSRLNRADTRVYFAGTRHRVREALFTAGLAPPLVNYKTDVQAALTAAKKSRTITRYPSG